jgi:hypothetical protein
MALQFDQLNNQLKTNDSTNANASMTLTPSGTGSVLLNGTGQNLVTYSQNLLGANWVNNQTSVSASLYTAPDGTSTANDLIETATTNLHYIAIGFSAISGVAYTYSVYLKVGNGATAPSYVQLSLSSTAFNAGIYANFNLSTGTVGTTLGITTSSITSIGNGWYRCLITSTATATASTTALIGFTNNNDTLGRLPSYAGATTSDVFVWGAQVEVGSIVNAYKATTTTAIYNAPVLSFSGVSNIGLQSDGSLYVQPAGTGAIQAQATTSSTVGGNARGANAVDWQTIRGGAAQVASGAYSNIGGGNYNTATGYGATVAGGTSITTSGGYSAAGGGFSNTVSGLVSGIFTGYGNTTAGYYNFVGGGQSNSGTSGSAVTTQSATMNGTTAVTLSGSNASIKVGQLVTGTSITPYPATYVAAISGTALTLSQAASGSSTSTLSFYTPHGVVVGGGNNQATGSYSFIGGGGDAGTSSNRNVASGDWSFVGGGKKNTASGLYSTIAGGDTNTASGDRAFVGSGFTNVASGLAASVLCGYNNFADGEVSAVFNGRNGTTRSISSNAVFTACNNPIADGRGFSQSALLVLGRQTTDATATVLSSNASAASTTNQVILPNNSAYYFKGEVVSGVTGGGNTKGWEISGLIKRGANAAATTLVGSTVTSLYGDAGASTWTIAVTADTTNGGLAVTFTGQAATTIRTVCQIRTTECTY